jgi:hypothetical protein
MSALPNDRAGATDAIVDDDGMRRIVIGHAASTS